MKTQVELRNFMGGKNQQRKERQRKERGKNDWVFFIFKFPAKLQGKSKNMNGPLENACHNPPNHVNMFICIKQ